jgi:hypothetical protein
METESALVDRFQWMMPSVGAHRSTSSSILWADLSRRSGSERRGRTTRLEGSQLPKRARAASDPPGSEAALQSCIVAFSLHEPPRFLDNALAGQRGALGLICSDAKVTRSANDCRVIIVASLQQNSTICPSPAQSPPGPRNLCSYSRDRRTGRAAAAFAAKERSGKGTARQSGEQRASQGSIR